MITKIEVALLAVAILVAFSAGVYVGRPATQPVTMLPKEVLELSCNANFSPLQTNPNDIVAWATLLPQARVCDECNTLREWRDVPGHTSRPITLSVKGYTMVFGTVSYSNGHRLVSPTIAYYVGHQSGSLARIGEDGKVEYRVTSDQWRPGDEFSPLVMEARDVFQNKWRAQLIANKR